MHTTSPKIKLEGAVPSVCEFVDSDQTSIPNSIIIKDSHSAKNVFCCAAIGDTTTGTFYTNMTDTLSVTSLKSIQDLFVAYDYDTNTIFAKPCPDKDATIIVAFKEVFNELKAKGYEPQFNMMDNQTIAPINACLKTKGCK